jgi:hypothetical protein
MSGFWTTNARASIRSDAATGALGVCARSGRLTTRSLTRFCHYSIKDGQFRCIIQVSTVGAAYKIPETQISHNRFDDETIVVNLTTGSYFSFHNTAAELWSLLERGPATAISLAAAFADAPVCASGEIGTFLERLHGEGLLTECLEEPVQSTSAQTYSTPFVEEFDELRELLLADIVHDTDEAGWPHLITK